MMFLLNFWEIIYPWVKIKILRYRKRILGGGDQVEEDLGDGSGSKEGGGDKNKDKKKKKTACNN